jgi:cytochrome P450
MFGDGIFTQEGSAWKHSRDMLRPQLHRKHYEDLEVFRESVDNLIRIIENRHSNGVMDLQPLFFRLTIDTTTAFLFGESVDSLTTPETVGEQTFATAFDTAQKWVMKRYRLLDMYWLIDGWEFHRACRDVHEFADQIIDRNLSRDKPGSDKKEKISFLDAVAEGSSDRAALRGQIINMLAAGRDTTACLLSWTLYVTKSTKSHTVLMSTQLPPRPPPQRPRQAPVRDRH